MCDSRYAANISVVLLFPPTLLGISCAPFQRTVIDPANDNVNLGWTEPAVVSQQPDMRLSNSGRHLLVYDHGSDLCRPGMRFLIRNERYGPEMAGAVASLAVLHQNRLNILIERNGSSRDGKGRHHDG